MTESPPAYPAWKAPAEDGGLLIWPDVPTLLAQTRENQRRLSQAAHIRVQNLPLTEVRRRMRQWLYADEQQPLIAAGHQIELYHPGVWAKNLFINELARKAGGTPYHLAIGTDAPKHLQLHWPGGSFPITDDPRLHSAHWARLLAAPPPAHLSEIESAFRRSASAWLFRPLLEETLSAMRRLSLESDDLAWVLVNACHQLDWTLGLRHHSLLVGPIWTSAPFLVFVHHLLSHAQPFATAYNRCLREYRQEEGITNAGRPWPDLRTSPEQIEAPFWLDDLQSGRRTRAVVAGGPQPRLRVGDDAFAFDGSAEGWSAAERLGRFLAAHQIRLAPRAATLTMFIRLFMADQFVHGIGGARYDQVTDRVIAGFFGTPAPWFSVTTATLLFPSARSEKRVSLEPLRREGRRLRHGSLAGDKAQFLQRIGELPRYSLERRAAFHEMHRMLSQNLRHPQYKAWEDRFAAAKQLRQEHTEIFDRELFYAIQPRARLEGLIEQYREAFDRSNAAG